MLKISYQNMYEMLTSNELVLKNEARALIMQTCIFNQSQRYCHYNEKECFIFIFYFNVYYLFHLIIGTFSIFR